VYGFAVLDPGTLTIRAHDSWADFDNEFYKQVTAFKAEDKKVLLALGGWNDSKGGKYSKVSLACQVSSSSPACVVL
jgi:chitinase